MSGDPSGDPPAGGRPTSAGKADDSWGGWLSSMANSAYETVAGPTSAPESFTALTAEGGAAGDGEGHGAENEFRDVDDASRQALWKQLLSVVGMDVMNMRLSLPIWVFEPSTALTRMAEMYEYSELLDRATREDDPALRDALVAAFLVSAYAHTERVRKPFNPVLGETFAFESAEKGIKFLAEQVSHHPPISASYCEGTGWTSGEAVDIQATYLGNSIEIRNCGPQADRFLHFAESGDRYTWVLATAVVSNLFVGGTYVDHYGTLLVRNETTGTVSNLNLTRCGWFSAGRYQVAGELLAHADGPVTGTYRGEWNKFFDFEKKEKQRGEGVMRLWMAGKHILPEDEGGGVGGALPKFTRFARDLLTLPSDSDADGNGSDAKRALPPTDSRLRPDRLALQAQDTVLASEEKLRIEQSQRVRLAKTGGASRHEPRWFKRTGEGENTKWEKQGDYWGYAASLSEEQYIQDALW